jgi:ABC-2 type transport system permease protein
MPEISLRRLLALTRKEAFQIVRDPSSILIAFVFPMLMLFLYGFGLSFDTSRTRIGIVLEDLSPEARDFAWTFGHSPYIDMVEIPARPVAAEQLIHGQIRGFVVVPSNFSEAIARAGTAAAPIQIITDGSETNTANFVEADARGVYNVWQQQRARRNGSAVAAPIDLEPRFWYNPAAVSRNFLVPGSIAVIMTVIGALLTALVVAREWERGTMEALLSTPVTRAELLLSKLLPYYLLGQIALLLCVAFGRFVLDVPFRGSLAILLLVSTFFLGAALGLGLLLSTLMRNQFNAAQAALNAAFLPAMMLSGFVFEIASMPAPIRAVTYLLPARYFVAALQTLFQVGAVWSVLIVQIGFLAGAAVVMLAVAAFKMRRRLE